MSSKIKTAGVAVAFAIVGAIGGSMLTAHAQPFRLRPSGSYRLTMNAGDVSLPTMVTFMGDGGIVGTTVPLSCLAPGQTLGGMHGQWEVRLERGVPVAFFHLIGDIYQGPTPPPIVPGDTFDTVPGALPETSYVGSLEIFGTAPVSTGPVKGEATISIPPGPCAERYNGRVSFTAVELPAVQKTPTDQ